MLILFLISNFFVLELIKPSTHNWLPKTCVNNDSLHAIYEFSLGLAIGSNI